METTINKTWIDTEIETLEEQRQKSEFPALKLEEGKITVFEVDFSKPFDEWVEPETGTVKKIIPVIHDGEQKVFWLNTRNPLYGEMLKAYKELGQNLFKVMRTGTAKDTKFNMVKE